MDVYENPSLGPQDPMNVPLREFNPGDLNVPGAPNHFTAGGVFWTRAVPLTSVTVHPGRGNARFVLEDSPMLDYGSVLNAILLNGAPPIPATASVEVHWQGTGERLRVNNAAAGFGGQYESALATMEWSASTETGYAFSTANSSETNVVHAFTAHVRTGIFYR